MTSLTEQDEFAPLPSDQIWSGPMTLVWGAIILFFWALFQLAGGAIAAFNSPNFDTIKDAFLNSKEDVLKELLTHGDIIWMSAFVSSILGCLLVMLIIKVKRGLNIREYLHLNIPPIKVWLTWLGAFFLFTFILEFASRNIEGLETDFMQKVLGNASNLPMLVLTIGVLGPIFEEVFFRGFVFKGWESSVIGGHGAVWATAIIFSFLHLDQYNLAIVMAIIPMGLLLGYARMYSGSLLVPILLHVINNLVATWLGLSEMGM